MQVLHTQLVDMNKAVMLLYVTDMTKTTEFFILIGAGDLILMFGAF